jgi:hypothetical protein
MIVGSHCLQKKMQPAFANYIQTHWSGKMERWVKGALEGIDHSRAYTNAHIETYHGVLKEFDLKGRSRLKGRHLDWLVCQLLTVCVGRYKCESFFHKTNSFHRIPRARPWLQLISYVACLQTRGRSIRVNLEFGVMADAVAAAMAAEARHASGAGGETAAAPAVVGRVPARYLPAVGAPIAEGEHAGELLPEKLSALCSDLQALCVRGLRAAEGMPKGSLGRMDQHEAYSVGVNGVQRAILSVEQVVARLESAARAGSLLAAAPAPLQIAPGALSSWSIGRLGAASLGDRGTAWAPRKPPARPQSPSDGGERPAPHLAVVALPTGGAGQKAKKKRGARKGAIDYSLRHHIVLSVCRLAQR